MSVNITIAIPLETIATLQANKSGSLPRAAAQQITQAVKAAAKALPVDMRIHKKSNSVSSTKPPSRPLAASSTSESSETTVAGHKRRRVDISDDSEDEDESDEDLDSSPQKPRIRRDHRIMHERGVSPRSFQLFVKTLTGKMETLQVDLFWQVKALKRMIEEKTGMAPNQQRLMFAGKQLQDKCTLESYGIQREDTVHIVLRLKGS